MKGLFISGSGTDVGKTFNAKQLLRNISIRTCLGFNRQRDLFD